MSVRPKNRQSLAGQIGLRLRFRMDEGAEEPRPDQTPLVRWRLGRRLHLCSARQKDDCRVAIQDEADPVEYTSGKPPQSMTLLPSRNQMVPRRAAPEPNANSQFSGHTSITGPSTVSSDQLTLASLQLGMTRLSALKAGDGCALSTELASRRHRLPATRTIVLPSSCRCRWASGPEAR